MNVSVNRAVPKDSVMALGNPKCLQDGFSVVYQGIASKPKIVTPLSKLKIITTGDVVRMSSNKSHSRRLGARSAFLGGVLGSREKSEQLTAVHVDLKTGDVRISPASSLVLQENDEMTAMESRTFERKVETWVAANIARTSVPKPSPKPPAEEAVAKIVEETVAGLTGNSRSHGRSGGQGRKDDSSSSEKDDGRAHARARGRGREKDDSSGRGSGRPSVSYQSIDSDGETEDMDVDISPFLLGGASAITGRTALRRLGHVEKRALADHFGLPRQNRTQ